MILNMKTERAKKMNEPILSFRSKYYFLSNFYMAQVTYNGITYCNNEAAFQAQKDLSRSEEFKELAPNDAKRLGRRVNLRPDWEDVKLDIMYGIVKAKFEQNPELSAKLIATGDTHLEEGNTWGDRTWGTVDGNGNNLLGLILMKVREELGGKPEKLPEIQNMLYVVSRSDGKWYGGYEKEGREYKQVFNTDIHRLFFSMKSYTDKGYAVKCIDGNEAKVFMLGHTATESCLKEAWVL